MASEELMNILQNEQYKPEIQALLKGIRDVGGENKLYGRISELLGRELDTTDIQALAKLGNMPDPTVATPLSIYKTPNGVVTTNTPAGAPAPDLTSYGGGELLGTHDFTTGEGIAAPNQTVTPKYTDNSQGSAPAMATPALQGAPDPIRRMTGMEQGAPLGDAPQGDPQAVDNGGIPTGEGWGDTGPSMDSGRDDWWNDPASAATPDTNGYQEPASRDNPGNGTPDGGLNDVNPSGPGDPGFIGPVVPTTGNNPNPKPTTDPGTGRMWVPSNNPLDQGWRVGTDPSYQKPYDPGAHAPSTAGAPHITVNTTPGLSDMYGAHGAYYSAEAADKLAKAQSGLYDAQAEYQRAQSGKDQAQIEQAKANLAEQQRQFDQTTRENEANRQMQHDLAMGTVSDPSNPGGPGVPTLANLKQQADIAAQNAQTLLAQGKFKEAQDEYKRSTDLQEQAQQFGQGISAAGLTGNYNGQDTQAAIKQRADIEAQRAATQLAQGRFAYEQAQNPFSFVQRAYQARGMEVPTSIGSTAAVPPLSTAGTPGAPPLQGAPVPNGGIPTGPGWGTTGPTGEAGPVAPAAAPTQPPTGAAPAPGGGAGGFTETGYDRHMDSVGQPTQIGTATATPGTNPEYARGGMGAPDPIRRTASVAPPLTNAPLSAKDVVDQTPGLSMVYSGKTPGAFHSGLAPTSAQGEASLLPSERAARDATLRATGTDPADYQYNAQQMRRQPGSAGRPSYATPRLVA